MQPLLGRYSRGLTAIARPYQPRASSIEPGVLAGPAQLREVGDLVLSAGRADPDDQVIQSIEPPDPVDVGFGGRDIPLETQGLGELHRRDAVIGLGAQGCRKCLDCRIEVVARRSDISPRIREIRG